MGAYDHILKKSQPTKTVEKPKQSEQSNTSVLVSSLAKGVAGIPDMFVNAAPSLVGLGMAGSGFVSNELAERLGRDTTLGGYFSKVNELANQGLSNFAYAPSIANKALRAVAPIQDPVTPSQRVIDWAAQSATGALLTPAASVKDFALNAAKLDGYRDWETDRKSTRLNSSHSAKSRMPSSA